MTKAPYFLIWVAMERRLYHLHTEIRIGHFYTGLTGLEGGSTTDLYKRLDSASIIWTPPEIETGSYAHLRPNL